MPVLIIDTDKMLDVGFKKADINKIYDCKANRDLTEKAWYFAPAKVIEQILKTSNSNLSVLSKQGRFPGKEKINYKTSAGYDMRKCIKMLWDLASGENIDLDIKRQKHRKLMLENKAVAGEYVSKNTAEERVIRLLKAVQRMFQYVIKTSAPMVIGCPKSKEAENILRDQFQDIFDTLERECNKIEWKDEKSAEIKAKD